MAVGCIAAATAPVPWAESAGAPLATPGDDATPPLTVEEILEQPLADAAYVRRTRCLSTGRYRRIEIVSDRALLFLGRGDRAWVNLLRQRCAGLRPDDALVTQRRDLRMCAGDRVQGLADAAAAIPNSICVLGDFHQVAKDNLDAMRDALRSHRGTATVRRTVRTAGPSSR